MSLKSASILIFLIFSTFSCSRKSEINLKQHEEKTLLINLGSEPPTLDPRKISDNLSFHVAKMCYDGLTRMGPSKEPVLSLAESFSLSEDKKIYIFKLKETCWSSGKPLTSYDFEQTWKQILSESFASPSCYAFYDILNAKKAKEGEVSHDQIGIKALDTRTLKIELCRPNPYFLHLLSTPIFYPYPESVAENNQHFIEKKENSFVGIGPFLITSWKPQDKMILQKNMTYFDESEVSLDKIEISFISDQNTELAMYEQGEIDWMGSPFSSLPSDAITSLKQRDDFFDAKIGGVYYYVFNTQKFPLTNASIRKALSYAINRKELIHHIFQTNTEPATKIIPSILSSNNAGYFEDGDIKKAKKLYEKGCTELGINPEDFPKITLSYNSAPSIHKKIAQAIQQQWKKNLGIQTALCTEEWKVFLDTLSKRNFEAARSGFASLTKDPSFFLEIFAYENAPINHSGWYNPLFSSYFEKAKEASDIKRRWDYINLAEELLLEQMPVAPLFFYTNCYLKKSYLSKVVIDELGYVDFKWAVKKNKE